MSKVNVKVKLARADYDFDVSALLANEPLRNWLVEKALKRYLRSEVLAGWKTGAEVTHPTTGSTVTIKTDAELARLAKLELDRRVAALREGKLPLSNRPANRTDRALALAVDTLLGIAPGSVPVVATTRAAFVKAIAAQADGQVTRAGFDLLATRQAKALGDAMRKALADADAAIQRQDDLRAKAAEKGAALNLD